MKISHIELEKRLATPVERYQGGYAQIAAGDSWDGVEQCLRRIGEVVKRMRGEDIIRAASLDIAFNLYDGMAAITREIPSGIALLAGQSEIGMAISVYLIAKD